MSKQYKKYMLKCQEYQDYESDAEASRAGSLWKNRILYFETEEDMKKFVRNNSDIRVEAAFRLEQLNNNIFV